MDFMNALIRVSPKNPLWIAVFIFP